MLPELGEIKKLRRHFNLTQVELAEIAGVSQSLVAKIEAGALVPTYDKAKRILDLLEKMGQEATLKASDIMARKLFSVAPADSAKKAVSLMERKSISQVPVIDKGTSIGTISEKTILTKLGEFGKTDLGKVKVSEIMDDSLPAVQESTPVKIVAELLNFNSAVLVVKKGKISGIVAKADLIKAMLKKG